MLLAYGATVNVWLLPAVYVAVPGVIDSFGIDRGVLMGNIENLLAYNKEHEKLPMNQDSLFGLMTDTSTLPTLKLDDVDKVSEKERLAWEKELLGLYISGHPLDPYREKISSRDMDIAKAKLIDDTEKEVIIPCIVEMVKPLNTKKGDMMAFLTLSDFSGSIEAVAFPKLYESSKSLLQVDKCLAVKGKVNERNGVKSFVIEKVKEL
jgi:DNA polymerase-3 subunit alpha